MTANAQQEENLSRSGKIKKRLTEIWALLEPYRLGFGLGVLAVAATIILILTGQKSDKLNFRTQATTPAVVTAPKEAGPSGSPQTLGASVSAQPSNSSSSLRPPAGGVRPAAISPKVNINTASIAALDSLPQIGPVTARAIIDYRSAHGPFKRVEDLDNVKGIGPKTIERLRNLIVVD